MAITPENVCYLALLSYKLDDFAAATTDCMHCLLMRHLLIVSRRIKRNMCKIPNFGQVYFKEKIADPIYDPMVL